MPMPTKKHGTSEVLIPQPLETYSHVFLKINAAHAELHQPYGRLFHVMERSTKYFKILCNSKETVVSIDHLKPAFILADDTRDIPNSLLVAHRLTSTSSSKTTDTEPFQKSPRHPDVAIKFDPLSGLPSAVLGGRCCNRQTFYWQNEH